MATYDDMMRAAKQQALWQGLMGLGGQMLQGGDPRQPQSFGAGLGRGVQAFGQGYQNAFSNQLQSEMARMQMAQAERQTARENSQQGAMATLTGGLDPNTGINWNTGRAGMSPQQEMGLLAQASPEKALERMYPAPLRGKDRYTAGPNGQLVDLDDPQAVQTANALTQGGMFSGSGIEAQVMNTVMGLRPKIENGTATDLERQAYQLAMERMQKPQTYTDPMTGGLVSRPGMPLTGFPGAGSAPAPAMGGGATGGMPASPTGAPAPTATGGPGITSVGKMATEYERLRGALGDEHPAVQALKREIDNTGKATEGEKKGGLFAARMDTTVPVLERFEGEGTKLGQALAAGIPLVGNYLLSPEYQQYDQAKRDFTNATLRQESGAVIGDSEFANAERQYFPVPGDSKEVIAQKRRNRETVRAQFREMAGPNYNAARGGPPEGVDPAVWGAMTPEQRALWQN
jgi:hypothetical protein